jgi:hypothetical protein
VGDFNGNGMPDLGVWSDDRFHISLSGTPGGVGFGSWSTTLISFDFGFIGTREQPVAADFDGDGFDDIGLWVPDRLGAGQEGVGEWYILVSGGQSVLNRIVMDPLTGRPTIHFTPIPFGNDMYGTFGNEFAIPVVGNFDPPLAPAGSGVTATGWTNPSLAADVNGDGIASPSDVISMINAFNSGGVRELTGTRPVGELYLDVNGDGWFSPQDILAVITVLNQNAAAGPSGGEGESATVEVASEAIPVTQLSVPQSVVAQSVVLDTATLASDSSAVQVEAGVARLNNVDSVFAEEDEEELDGRIAALPLASGDLELAAGDMSAWDDGLDAVLDEILGSVAR